MATCTEEKLVVKTKRGTYTLPNEDYVVERCAAEAKCLEMGAILAPFTEKDEFDAVMSAIKSCEHAPEYYAMHVGLSISKDNAHRIFSNGVEFDYSVHGHLYKENLPYKPGNCPFAVLIPLFPDKIQIDTNSNCVEGEELYMCFKPNKSAKPDAISSDATKVDLNFVVAGASIFIVAVVCLVCFFVKHIKNLKLKLHQNSDTV